MGGGFAPLIHSSGDPFFRAFLLLLAIGGENDCTPIPPSMSMLTRPIRERLQAPMCTVPGDSNIEKTLWINERRSNQSLMLMGSMRRRARGMQAGQA
jgi:hypothetical protein